MTEWEKAQNGYLYDANYDKEIIEARTRCADLCYEFNNCRPSDTEKQQKLNHIQPKPLELKKSEAVFRIIRLQPPTVHLQLKNVDIEKYEIF